MTSWQCAKNAKKGKKEKYVCFLYRLPMRNLNTCVCCMSLSRTPVIASLGGDKRDKKLLPINEDDASNYHSNKLSKVSS